MSLKYFQNWKIENFSCWNKDVHAKCIKSPQMVSFCNYMQLYPRGFSGIDEHLVVRFCDIKKEFSGGELSFIGSDESILCTPQVKGVNIQNVLDSPLGPKYEEVIARIIKEDEVQLTLQFTPSGEKLLEQSMCTNISVQRIFLKIDKSFIESVKSDSSQPVYFSSYCKNEGFEGIIFKVAHKNERIQLILDPYKSNQKPIFIKSCMRLISNNSAFVRNEENKHVFVSEEPWTFLDSIIFKEFVDEGNSLNVCFKIVKGDLKEKYNYLFCRSVGDTILQNNNFWVPEQKSSKGLASFSSKQTGDSMTKPTKDNSATSNQLENSVSALAKELMCLYQDQDFFDLQLKCGSVSFPVHKNILSTRSPVFKRMLSNDMREAASGTVDIEDLDVPTLARFLTFLYSGSVDDLEGESALKLYYAADKYQVPTLKKECVDFLIANVSLSNVCDVLSLADQHQDDVLLSAARDFILNNLNEVSRSEEWMSFMKREPLLVAETMTHFTAKDFVTKK